MTVFDQIFTILIGEEGGYSNDPHDPGGETKYGISKAAYPQVDIAGLTIDTAKAIYVRDFWAPCRCDDLPAGLALMVFDAAVNNDCERAREWLQAAVGVAQDGVIGPQTMTALLAAVARPGGVNTLCAEFLARRIDFMGLLKTWQRFGLGWSRRLAALPYKALSIAQQET